MVEREKTDPEKWVDIYGDYLYSFAISRVQNSDVAQDMVQETFLAALRNRESFKGLSSERTWFTSILKHKIVDYFRKTGKLEYEEGLTRIMDSADEPFDENGRWRAKPAKWMVNPAKLLERKEFWEIFNNCLSKLPARLSQAFKLREMDGLNCDEICNVHHISASNCWIRLYRARLLIRRCLEINWFEAEATQR